MTAVKHNLSNKQRRQQRVHARVQARAGRPKLVLVRSNKHLAAQVIDDQGKVLLAANDFVLVKTGQMKSGLTKTQRAEQLGQHLAGLMKKAKITTVAVDRGSCQFHGRIKALVEALRANGIEA